ncbi:hypothetical protein [Lactiplantibacillus carotarum]|uniref:hypothetical protein n=1 Tax=Lactiplantibacillus carotarum TaxID=2993456 RepID=UPI00298F1C47|nr:hypothetical protein [Lactiplantibacillus carotarum]
MSKLTKEQIELAARIGAETFRDTQRKGQKSDYEKKLRNTKLILENYRYLEKHVNVGLPKFNASDQEATALIPKWELSVYALLGFKARSKTMIEYVDLILKAYKEECDDNDNPAVQRRYRVIKSLYLNHPTISREKCAELFFVDHRTIDRDVKAAVHDLSILLWGADAINDISMMS